MTLGYAKMLRLVLKILLKVTIPLVLMLGVTSYSLYLRGGDPMALLSRVSGGAGASITSMVASVKDSTRSTLVAAKSTLTPSEGGSVRDETLYRWLDADGSPHYSNVKPVGVRELSVVKVDPDQNLLDSPAEKDTAPAAATEGLTLPGAAGMALPGGDPLLLLGNHP